MGGVRFEGVSKRFGDVVAVDDFDLDIADREFLVLLGPSGCGKSTALRMIAGLDEPTTGVVRIGDRAVNDVDPRDRDIAMVFQSYALYPHMSVAKNIEAPLLVRRRLPDGTRAGKLSRAERGAKVAEAAEMLGLTEVLDRKPGALSGGQRQRVALARALVRRPEVFLMDEPLSNLDAKLRTQTRLELVDLWRRVATTFVYVTHDQVEAMTMASRVAVMNEGRLQQVGAPQEVYARPATLFVARFIGSPPMNTFPATIGASDGRTVARFAGAEVELRSRYRLAEGAEIVLGVRPEHLLLDPDGQMSGTLEAVELLGHEVHLIVAFGGAQFIARRSAEDPVPALGDEVRFRPESDHLHVFDAVDGRRLDAEGDA